MPKKKTPPKVVIDACVAGRHSGAVAGRCRAFLEKFRESDLIFVCGPTLQKEWDDHATRISERWLAAMQARRRIEKQQTDNIESVSFLLGLTEAEANRAAIEKDLHLIGVALVNSCCVASSDGLMRDLLAAISDNATVLRKISWFDVTLHNVQMDEWIESVKKKGSGLHRLG